MQAYTDTRCEQYSRRASREQPRDRAVLGKEKAQKNLDSADNRSKPLTTQYIVLTHVRRQEKKKEKRKNIIKTKAKLPPKHGRGLAPQHQISCTWVHALWTSHPADCHHRVFRRPTVYEIAAAAKTCFRQLLACSVLIRQADSNPLRVCKRLMQPALEGASELLQ